MVIMIAILLNQSPILHAASDLKAESSPLITVIIDGRLTSLDRAPIISNGSTLVPFRPIFENLGLKVGWDPKAQVVTGTSKALQIRLAIGESYATVNGKKVKLPVASFIRDGGTFVPLRFVGETAGRKVNWDNHTRTITVNLVGGDKLYYPNGLLQYEGEIFNGSMHGQGKLYRLDGMLWYDSEFVDNEATGKGKMYFYTEDDETPEVRQTYEGDLVKGIPNGQGKYYDEYGQLAYEGELADGIPNGKGTFYIDGVKVYVGEWKDNQYDGIGTVYLPNGKIAYEGGFKANLRHGYGKLYEDSGKLYYEGYFADGRFDGEGVVYHNSTGRRNVGVYENGQRKYGKLYEEDGFLVYEGTYDKGYYDTGTMYFRDGTSYIGEFGGYKPHGQGTLYDANGQIVHQGEFYDGKPVT